MKKANRNTGVVSIEFAMGFFFFMLLFFVWAQIAYMGYVSGLIDYTLAKTARDTRDSVPTKANEDSYKQQFLLFLKEDAGIWGRLVDYNNFSVKSYFYDDVVDLADSCKKVEDKKQQKNCLESTQATSQMNAPIAVYQVSYHFSPLLRLFLSDPISLKREVFVVQEYERNKFYN